MVAEVSDTVKKFLEETIGAEGVRVVRVDKANGGWVAEAEVAEKNQFLASIRPEYRVFDKELYLVRLNAALEVYAYKRMRSGEEERDVSSTHEPGREAPPHSHVH